MTVYVKLSSTLRRHVSGYNPEKGLTAELQHGSQTSLLDLAGQLGLPISEIKFAMLNGRYQPLSAILQPDDRVAYFPAVGGG